MKKVIMSLATVLLFFSGVSHAEKRPQNCGEALGATFINAQEAGRMMEKADIIATQLRGAETEEEASIKQVELEAYLSVKQKQYIKAINSLKEAQSLCGR